MSKLDNPQFKAFIEKYTEHEAPSRVTIIRVHVDKTYIRCLDEARTNLGDDLLCVALDSTSDILKRSVASFIVGSLEDKSKGPYLINMKEMGSGTTEAYLQFFNESLNGFFGEGELFAWN